MAGSYKHIITDQGNLVSNESFAYMINNLGDAYEMSEEMFGMIWWLAGTMPSENADQIKERVEAARQNYGEGLKIAKQVNRREQ